MTPRTATHQASCPSPSPGFCSNSCPLSQWCHPTISSSVASFFPSITIFSNGLALRIRWTQNLELQFQHQSFSEYSGLISFRTDWFDFLAVQGNLKNLLQHHNLKTTILWHSAFFIAQLSHPYITGWKTLALIIWTYVGKVISLLSRFVIVFFQGASVFLFLYFFALYLFIYFWLYNTVLVLPYTDMNPTRVYMSSQSWTRLPPPSPYHLSGSSQCTSPKHPVSCIEHRLAICFLHDSIHVSMSFSQIIPPCPSPTESKSLFYTSVSLLLSRIKGYHYHHSKFHIYVLVYCIGVFLSGLLHSV